MNENQKINCTVKTCVYQDNNNKRCTLKSINVMPTEYNMSGETDESMCGNYKCNNK